MKETAFYPSKQKVEASASSDVRLQIKFSESIPWRSCIRQYLEAGKYTLTSSAPAVRSDGCGRRQVGIP